MKYWLVLAFLLVASPALSQGAQCRTSPIGASTPYCASEAFVTQSTAAAGDVTGPGSSTTNGFAVYADTTGKVIKDHPASIALTSEVTGVLPVANGGTNYSGVAWTTYAPTITALAGAFTTVAAAGSFLVIGKLVHFTVTITVTAAGTAAGAVIMTLPAGAAARPFVVSGAETQNTGKAAKGYVLTSGSTAQVTFYDNSFPGTSGNVITLTGIYEQS